MPAATNLLSILEPLLLAIALFFVLRRRELKRFPAFGMYLACRLGVFAALAVLLELVHMSTVPRQLLYATYYYIYWIGYLADAIVAFFVIQEVFTSVMRPYPGLSRLGRIGFYWVALISVLIAVAVAAFTSGTNHGILLAATSGIMRCASIFELCLLAFILLSMQTMQTSAKSRQFGISLGLAMVAAAELFGSAFAFGHTTMASIANYSSQIVVTLAALGWVFSFVRQEPVAKPVDLAANSHLFRWNEIANALVKGPPQVALTPNHDLFMQDVEHAVDKVLRKNSVNPAS